MKTYDFDNDMLYKKYKYYNATEKTNTVKLLRNLYHKETFSVKQQVRTFNHTKFEGFYLIHFYSSYLNELKETMIFFNKDRELLEDKIYILYYHLKFGDPNNCDANDIINEYCYAYDTLQKINFIENLPKLLLYKMSSEDLITVIKLSEVEYKTCEKFLLKQLNPSIGNISKIEHYPKRGFITELL